MIGLDRPTQIYLLCAVSLVACVWLSIIWLREWWANERRRRRPTPEEWAALIEGEDGETIREWIREIRQQANDRRSP